MPCIIKCDIFGIKVWKAKFKMNTIYQLDYKWIYISHTRDYSKKYYIISLFESAHVLNKRMWKLFSVFIYVGIN